MTEGHFKSFLMAWIAQDPDRDTPALESFHQRVAGTTSDAEAQALVRAELGELGVRLLGQYAQTWPCSAADLGNHRRV